MKAQNLTISIPCEGKCDKNCEYCISKMTGYLKPDLYMMRRNLPKVRNLLERADAAFVLFTGKKEPLLNFEVLLEFANYFKDYPIEIQTNGLRLNKHREWIHFLEGAGVDVFAFSIDDIRQMERYRLMFKAIADVNLTTRICLNLTNKISTNVNFEEIFSICKSYPVQQLLVRNIMIPDKIVNTEESHRAAQWIKSNVDPVRYYEMYMEFLRLSGIAYAGSGYGTLDKILADVDNRRTHLVRKLPHGALVWDHEDIAVSFSDYCIQEANNTEDIRSLILQDTGHVDTSWDKKASRLF